MKTANLAIVFTDIKGYTARTSQQTHAENQRMLRVHDALLTPVFRAFGGRLVKTIGDAFLVVFDSPTQAVLAGVAIQDRLWDYNRRVAEPEQIRVRVAINMGEVRVERGDVFGEPVNIAARVEGLAEAGEVLFTEAVYLAMNKAEVPSEDRGVHALKGIPEPVKVYRVPQGGYRLASTTERERPSEPPSSGCEGPPYGGIALARAADLPEPDPRRLLEGRELMGQLGTTASALASGAARRAETFGERARAGLARGRAWFAARSPRERLGLIAAGVALVIAAVALPAFPFDPIERTIRAHEFAEARREIKRLPAGPRSAYLEGRLAEEKGEFAAAASGYETAARLGSGRAFRRLLALTEHEKCAARASAARALGSLGDTDALAALRELEEARFEDEEAPKDVLGAIFGCQSRRAAHLAVQKLEARED